jgi:hypothetical protein
MPLSALIAAVLLAPGPGVRDAVRVFIVLALEGDASVFSVVLWAFESGGTRSWQFLDLRDSVAATETPR